MTTKTFPIKCRCHGWITFKNVMRNGFLSVLWIVTILIDGDAYVCWKLTDIHENMNWTDQLPCKEKNNLTADESKNITKCQSESQVIGLAFLFTLPVLFFLISIIHQCCLKSYYKSLFEEVYEEETLTAVEVKIRENIKNNAKETLNHFNECRYDDGGWKNLSDELNKLIFEYNPTSVNDQSEETSEVPEDVSSSDHSQHL